MSKFESALFMHANTLYLYIIYIYIIYIYMPYICIHLTFNIQYTYFIFILVIPSQPTQFDGVPNIPKPLPGQSRTTQAFGDAKIGNLHTTIQGWPCGTQKETRKYSNHPGFQVRTCWLRFRVPGNDLGW